MLSAESKQQLLRRFPDVKLSYDRSLHKKVSADMYFIIPKGPKAFLWITHLHHKNVALILTLGNRGSIRKIDRVVLAFNDRLSHGTLLYGTIFTHEGRNCFCFEDLHQLEGRCTEKLSLADKLTLLNTFFQFTKESRHSQTTIGVPVIEKSYKDAVQKISVLPYKVYGIHACTLRGRDGPIGTYIVKATPPQPRAIFRVRATTEADIYELFCRSGSTECLYGMAMIPTYKKSVEMNGRFRTIKENINLDLLEESDDEEEFENVSPDKFVNLEKTVIMECIYMRKFRKWYPDIVITEMRTLSDKRDIMSLEKK